MTACITTATITTPILHIVLPTDSIVHTWEMCRINIAMHCSLYPCSHYIIHNYLVSYFTIITIKIYGSPRKPTSSQVSLVLGPDTERSGYFSLTKSSCHFPWLTLSFLTRKSWRLLWIAGAIGCLLVHEPINWSAVLIGIASAKDKVVWQNR